jgi:hypothetical protein
MEEEEEDAVDGLIVENLPITEDLMLHVLLGCNPTSIELTLQLIETYSSHLRQKDQWDRLPLHIECMVQCRSAIISKCIELYPESIAASSCIPTGCSLTYFPNMLPLHMAMTNSWSSVDSHVPLILMMIEKYPAALQHKDNNDNLPIHIECRNRCRVPIVVKCIELYPQSLKMANIWGSLPLHEHLNSCRRPSEEVLDPRNLIKIYPAALKRQDKFGNLPIHFECYRGCRHWIIARCIQLYPESLLVANEYGELPIRRLLLGPSADAITLMMAEECPESLRLGRYELPIRVECLARCRPIVISKFIQLYPESLALVDYQGYMPLHRF